MEEIKYKKYSGKEDLMDELLGNYDDRLFIYSLFLHKIKKAFDNNETKATILNYYTAPNKKSQLVCNRHEWIFLLTKCYSFFKYEEEDNNKRMDIVELAVEIIDKDYSEIDF